MSADEIKKNMLLLEGNAPQEIEEAPMGLLKKLTTTAAALFSDLKLGELKAGEAANNWYAYYMRYLGTIGRKPTESTIGDLYTFLVDSGMKPKAVLAGITQGMSTPQAKLSTMDDLKKLWNTRIETDAKNRISKSMLAVVQNQLRKEPDTSDADDLAKQATQGDATVKKAAAQAAKPAAPAAKPAAAPVAAKTKQYKTADIDAALAQLGSKLDEAWYDRFIGKNAPENKEPTFDMVDTADPDLNNEINAMIQAQGKDAAIKYLQDLKAKMSTASKVSDDPYEKVKGEMRRLAGIKGAKTLPNTMIDRIKKELATDIQKLQKGDKDSGAYIGQKILKFGNAGYNMSRVASIWLAAAKAGERFLTASEYRDITKMLREYGFDWRDLGIKVRLDESISDGVFISEAC